MARHFVIIAGEASGDVHAAKLIRNLKKYVADLQVSGIGGDQMSSEGFDVVVHIKQMAVLGISEVIKHLPFIRRVFRQIINHIKQTQPEVIILVDYPGFNLRLAKKISRLNIPVIYYIGPQLWAWGKRRIKIIKRHIRKVLVIFPFEVDFYKQNGIQAEYVGHPIVDDYYHSVRPKSSANNNQRILGLLPGSRVHEIENILPNMLNTAEILFRNKQIDKVLIAKVNNIGQQDYLKYIEDAYPYVFLVEHIGADFYNSLDIALVKSGTSTLECAYFQVPFVIVYKVSSLTWHLGKMMVRLKNIGLANIVAGKQVAQELLQKQFVSTRAAAILAELIKPENNKQQRIELSIIREKMGTPGASDRAALAILHEVGKGN